MYTSSIHHKLGNLKWTAQYLLQWDCQQIEIHLSTDFFLPFELISIILLVILIGAIVRFTNEKFLELIILNQNQNSIFFWLDFITFIFYIMQ